MELTPRIVGMKLSPWQAQVLELRAEGLGYTAIALMRGCCRQAVQCVEAIALAKLGQRQQDLWDEERHIRTHQAAFYRERAALVRMWELRHDDKRPASWFQQSRQCVAEQLERATSHTLVLLEQGGITRDEAWKRIAELQADIKRGSCPAAAKAMGYRGAA